MAGGHIGGALRRLRGLPGAEGAGGPTDGELLRRFVEAHDETAFEALLRRHGPMVLGVCRRLLTGTHDVDDAFQATFLILLRKAHLIGDGERVGNWLYGVAYRVAVRARDQAARRRARQRMLTDLPAEEAQGPGADPEVRALLDEEVMRLPGRYREAVVCCYLQGRTQEEAARLLGWPKGTVATRLNRARALLRRRLVRRGLTLSAGALVLTLTPPPIDGAVPSELLVATVQVGGAALAGAAPPAGVASLADAVLRPLSLTCLKAAVAGALTFLAVVGGGTLAGRLWSPRAAPPQGPPVTQSRSASPHVADNPAVLPLNRPNVTVAAVAVIGKGRTASAGGGEVPAWSWSPERRDETTTSPGQSGHWVAFILTIDRTSSASLADDLLPHRGRPTTDRPGVSDSPGNPAPAGTREGKGDVPRRDVGMGRAARSCREHPGHVVALAILSARRPSSADRDDGDVIRETALKLRHAEQGALGAAHRRQDEGAAPECTAVALAGRAVPIAVAVSPDGCRAVATPGVVWLWSAGG
jgi:RNA polymerase sigma factor (sigma-70 family)